MVIISIAVLSPAATAQQQPPRAPERGVELISVDFVVIGSDGRPVEDLKADEVTVKVGGRTRSVRSLQLMRVADPAVAAGEVVAAEPLPPPFGTNVEQEDARTFVLIIDDDSFRAGREQPLRTAVDGFLKRLGLRDLVSLVTLPYGGVKVPLTTDHARIRKALSLLVGQAPENEDGRALACRTRRTLESLAGYLETLGIRQEPATVMFVTGALAAPRRDAPMSMAPGMCELRSELFEQVGVAAGAARARFYVIQPGDIVVTGTVMRENIAGVGFTGSDNPLEGIEHLAGVTGGKMLQLTGSADTALDRALRETAAHYVAAVDPDRNDRSGRSQQFEVRVRRPGVEVRTRPRITFPKPEPSLGRPTGLSVREMIGASALVAGLPLRATGYAALEADGQTVRVMTLTEPVEPGTKLSSLSAGLFNADGKLVSHWSATAAELQRTPVLGAMGAQPGGYRLRVAAIDTTGRAGSADYDLTVDLARTGPLKLSSLVFGLSREGAFVPRLQFSDEPVAIGYLELYGAAAGVPVTATLEVSMTTNGPALASVPLAIESAGPNRYVARGAIAIGALSPGDYVIRAMVGLEGHPMTRVVRTLRKVIGPAVR